MQGAYHEVNKPIKTLNIDGTTVAIFVSETDGYFIANDPSERGEWVRAETLKKLEEKLRKILRSNALRLDIPMTLLRTGDDNWRRKGDEPTAEPVTLTGIHSTNRRPLITRADGSKDTWESEDGRLVPRVSSEQAAEWIALVKAHRVAEAAMIAFRDQTEIQGGLEKFVRDYVESHGGKAEDVGTVEED